MKLIKCRRAKKSHNTPLFYTMCCVQYGMTELEILDQKTEEYLKDGINWDADKNEAIIAANKSDLARGDIEQLASDSFQEGWFASKNYFKSNK